MLYYISFGVRDLNRSGAFYDAALGALGLRRVFEDATAGGYELVNRDDDLCLKLRSDTFAPGPGFHLAFAAASRAAVDAFDGAAPRVAGIDNGVPGLRRKYGSHDYAAFLKDPDGYRIEVVTKAPPG